MANEIHNLEKVLDFKNVYQPVEFMNILMLKQQSILRLTSTKFPEMEVFGFLEKFILQWNYLDQLPDGLTEINNGD